MPDHSFTSPSSNTYSESTFRDVIIIGAGASGLMCAATAGYQGKQVLVLDHAPKAAAKIRISGGGKCNFTNMDISSENYICQNPHFVKSALSRYPSSAFIELVERHGLAYEQRELGKLFCSERASDLIQILRTECDWAGVEVQTRCAIQQLSYEDGLYRLTTSQGVFQCAKLVVASGALSFAKLKATGLGYDIARQFGLNVIETRPGLVPLSFAGRWQKRFGELSGLALDVSVTAGGRSFNEAILFTHTGLSGPGILQASNYWQAGEPIVINLLPKKDVFAELLALKKQGASLSKWLQRYLPKRMVQQWLEWYPLNDQPQPDMANISDDSLRHYGEQLMNWTLYPSDTAGYDKAEVTLGGVDTDEVSQKSFEAKKQPGLYFIGEVLDVTGHLGGYNFQWAWASGVACGLAL
ncbi:NAD(P)/FAD-dependent oxidoreductase [Thiomicrorhabdus sediminis]|uniref:NAD(P)/FAD-dependent oxidoreductase n=1 Tax=Thiomicrorhabdus sediminis TaxID=2580412 RepID=A0A4P9K319_9GAMM|nr:NAD(P)/FAD-dependent oxidoreductase [Thiomicrorhabdus sediminis]QCU89229.1 NAD(P)/FAD-dependent oxidoreductase [Thiomicrorhabdus sediminis]